MDPRDATLGVLALLAAGLQGCPTVTDQAPYGLAVADDDDTVDDDDVTLEPCDVSWIVEATETVSLSGTIEPIFFDHCSQCHVFQKRGKLNLTPGASYDELIDVPNLLLYDGDMPRVAPGDPQDSYLIHKLLGCDSQDPKWGYTQGPMPPDIPETIPLTEEKISLIWSWVLQGALDN